METINLSNAPKELENSIKGYMQVREDSGKDPVDSVLVAELKGFVRQAIGHLGDKVSTSLDENIANIEMLEVVLKEYRYLVEKY